jgi:hypothetical protein
MGRWVARTRPGCHGSGFSGAARAVKKFLRPCKDIQEALGGLNDVEVTRHLIDRLAVSCPAVAAAVRGR